MLEIINNINLEMLLRLLIAAILGLLIGLERELKRKSLGLKTILACFYPVGIFITWFRFG